MTIGERTVTPGLTRCLSLIILFEGKMPGQARHDIGLRKEIRL